MERRTILHWGIGEVIAVAHQRSQNPTQILKGCAKHEKLHIHMFTLKTVLHLTECHC